MNTEIARFVDVVNGSGEAGLLYCGSEAVQELEKLGFAVCTNPDEIGRKSYAIVSKESLKYWYDIATQFPTRQISWMDKRTHAMRSRDINPAENALILIVDSNVDMSELPLGRVTGPALSLTA